MAKRIVYIGVEMIEGWPERIEEAQKLLEYSIGQVLYSRIPYGAETMTRSDKTQAGCAVR